MEGADVDRSAAGGGGGKEIPRLSGRSRPSVIERADVDRSDAGGGGGFFGSSELSTAGDRMEIDFPLCDLMTIDQVLPESMLMEVLSRLPDAIDLIRCAAVNRTFRSSFTQVKAAKFICGKSLPGATPFKEAIVGVLTKLTVVENLRLEIEEKLQGKRMKADELDKNSLWLSERTFVDQWLPSVSGTLQNLTLIDYGQQAIFKASPLLQCLSRQCPNLRHLELRNLFLDCTGCEIMRKVKTLTLRCVKLTDAGLKDISRVMPNLESLTLVTVVGLREVEFTSDNLKILCLGLATKATSVKLSVQSLFKLQLKMPCPETLKVKAPELKSLALCMGQNKSLEFEQVKGLKELLMGASEFTTLSKLSATNPELEKVFMDVPCMAFEENGSYRRVNLQVPLNVPDMASVRASCPRLRTLSVGPGLWYAFENGMTQKDAEGNVVLPKWPTLKHLILHVLVLNPETSLALLKALMKALPTLTVLELYVHESSKVKAHEFAKHFQPLCPQLQQLKIESWKKGLKFGCFSF